MGLPDFPAVIGASDRRVRPALVLLLAVAVLAALAPVRPAVAGGPARRKAPRLAWPTDAVPGSLLVTRDDGTVEVVEVRAGTEGAAAARLLGHPGVVAVEPDHLRRALRTPSDPSYPSQWAHTLTRAAAAWDRSVGDRAVEVAVVDSGIDGTHAGLRANLVSQVDVSDGSVRGVALGTDNDACGLGHGTFVAGIVGATGNDTNDVAGVAWEVGLLDVAAADPLRCGSFSDSAIVAAIGYAVDQRVDVINLSLGGPSDSCPTAFQASIDEARQQGIVVVAAAGNDQRQFPGLTSVPASCNGVISVGAVGRSGVAAPYSSANALLDVAAPGGDLGSGGGVISTALGGGIRELEGTSFAAPYVSGAAALLRAIDPALTPDEVESILERTAQGGGARTPALGWGLVDLGAAAAMAASGTVLPPAADPVFPVGLVGRISAQESTTDAVRQAVAVSRFVFPGDGSAQHVVLARRDDFADALAGSALGFGVGPVLFTGRTGPLAATTAAEIERVLPPQGVVYLLGGPQALPVSLEEELRAVGLTPKRLSGPTRFDTAAAVADETLRRVVELGFPRPGKVILATARNWPDAVSAGSLAAWFGYPILLTETGSLPAPTRAALGRIRPERLYVIGGPQAVGHPTLLAAADAADAPTARLEGPDRSATAVAVGRQFTDDLVADLGEGPLFAIGVNVRRADGFAHVLSASAISGAGAGVYLPVEGEGGGQVPSSVPAFACSLDPVRGVVAGDGDLISEPTKARLNDLLEHTAPEC